MGRLATARRIKTAGRPRQPLLRQNRRFSSPHPFGRAGLARFEPRRLVSTSERRLPGENVCYLRNLGTDEPLTSMNGMARGRATSSLSQNRQNRGNREPTRTGSRSGSCTDPRHRPTPAGTATWPLTASSSVVVGHAAPIGSAWLLSAWHRGPCPCWHYALPGDAALSHAAYYRHVAAP